MKILNTLFVVAIVSISSIAYAAITVDELNEASFMTWHSLGEIQACSSEFPHIDASQLTTKLDNSLRRLVHISKFNVTNFDKVQEDKIFLSNHVTVSVIKGMSMKESKSEVIKWCEKVIISADSVLKSLEAKIESTKKFKNRNAAASDESKIKASEFTLKLTLLFTNSKATDIRNMLQKVPVNESFASEDECRKYLSRRMTNTEPGILGGAWVPHPTGEQIICEKQQVTAKR